MGKKAHFSTLVSAAATAALALGCMWTGSAQAAINLVQNGDFLLTSSGVASPGAYLCKNSGDTTCQTNLTYWDSTCKHNCGISSTAASVLFRGTGGSAFNGNRGLWAFSELAGYSGNYVAIDGDPAYNATIFQTITGLTVGQQYVVRFEQAAAQQINLSGDTTEWWQVSLGAESKNSATMSDPSHGFVGWYQQALLFTATATSEVLGFEGHGTPNGEPPIALMADVSLMAAPEPSTWAMMVLGFAGLGYAGVRSRRNATGAA